MSRLSDLITAFADKHKTNLEPGRLYVVSELDKAQARYEGAVVAITDLAKAGHIKDIHVVTMELAPASDYLTWHVKVDGELWGAFRFEVDANTFAEGLRKTYC